MTNLVDKYLDKFNHICDKYEDNNHIEWFIHHNKYHAINIIYHKKTMIYSTKILNKCHDQNINKNLLFVHYLNTCKFSYVCDNLYYDYELIESYNPIYIIMVVFGTPLYIIKKFEEEALLELKMESMTIS